jgi:transaldolase / glucose-6-phosphate isomerase
MGNKLLEVQKYGQSIWYDNIRRGIITSGQLQGMIDDDGLLGITSNPSIFEKAIVESTDYDQAIKALVSQGCGSPVAIYERLAIEDIQLAADMMHPVFVKTGGRDGYVSFEVAPDLAHDAEGTIEYARRVHALLGRENILIKVPGTPAGMPAITQLISEGISVNVTLLFAVKAYEDCALAYMEGLERYAAGGRDPGRIASVASFFISRIDSLVDKWIEKAAQSSTDASRKARLEKLVGRVAIANGIVAYEKYEELIASPRWQALAAKGARTQRVLWASTSTKDPRFSKTKYVDELIARDTVNTIPEETFVAYRDQGHPSPGLADGWGQRLADAKVAMRELADLGISIDDATSELLADGVKKFADAFQGLLASVEKKRSVLRAA